MAVMHKLPSLRPGAVFHVFNRGNNRENLFREQRNYGYFLDLYARHIEPVAETFAYCLLPNHFHLLVRIKSQDEQAYQPPREPSRQFSNLFNAYAKAINNTYGRSGSLFQKRFGRIEVSNRRYFLTLVRYIHQNPQLHGLVDDYRDYPFSSYGILQKDVPTVLQRARILKLFGGTTAFVEAHQEVLEHADLTPIVDQDFEGLVDD
jgi:putative transposase